MSQLTLGQRIREMRMKKGFTQSDLAKGICTASLVSQCESDRAKPSYKTLAQFADRLEVSLEQLISDVDLNLKFTSTQKMARAMVASKDFISAIPLLQELLDAPSGMVSRAEVMFNLAESYLYTGDLEQAEKWFGELKEIGRHAPGSFGCYPCPDADRSSVDETQAISTRDLPMATSTQ